MVWPILYKNIFRIKFLVFVLCKIQKQGEDPQLLKIRNILERIWPTKFKLPEWEFSSFSKKVNKVFQLLVAKLHILQVATSVSKPQHSK